MIKSLSKSAAGLLDQIDQSRGPEQCFSTRDILCPLLPPRGRGTISGGIFDCHNWEDASGLSWAEARDARSTSYKGPGWPHSKE